MTESQTAYFHVRRRDRTHVGEGLLARTLPRADWTHEAHLAATTYLLTLAAPTSISTQALPGIIRSYNESVGGVNSDSEGYHETITRAFLHGARLFLSEADFVGTAPRPRQRASALANGSPRLAPGFQLARGAVSVEARMGLFVAPDIVAIPVTCVRRPKMLDNR